LRISHEVSDLPTVAEGLEGLAAAAILSGNAEQTALLLGTADALRQRIGAPLPAASVADVARSRADAKTVLGPPAFESAYLAGAALTVEEALAMADLSPRGVSSVADG
jgi:hypothetical protein